MTKVTEAKGTALSNIATGFSVNILNPKVVIFFMTFLPQFVSAGDPAVTGNLRGRSEIAAIATRQQRIVVQRLAADAAEHGDEVFDLERLAAVA